MKPTELRIGNILYYKVQDSLDERKEWDEVHEIDAEDILFMANNTDNHKYSPIPITPEWLEKFGFKQWKDFTGDIEYSLEVPNDYGGSIIGSNYNGEFKVLLVGCNEGRVGNFIDYVHQLQNLTFALTGEELTVKQ